MPRMMLQLASLRKGRVVLCCLWHIISGSDDNTIINSSLEYEDGSYNWKASRGVYHDVLSVAYFANKTTRIWDSYFHKNL